MQPGGARPDVSTWAALSPLALPDLPEEIGRRLVEEHLLDPRRYWLTNPPPSVSAAEPTFEPNRGPGWKLRYWRGPTWVNAAWMLWLGMRRLGYDAEAALMAERLTDLVLRHGLREYYDPQHRRGPRRARVRLDEPDHGDGRAGSGLGLSEAVRRPI